MRVHNVRLFNDYYRRIVILLFVLLIANGCIKSLSVAEEEIKTDDMTVAIPDYPRIVETPKGKVAIHMPDIKSWENYETMTAWVAIAVTPVNSDETWIGSINFKAKSDIDFKERLVVFYDLEIIGHKFHKNIEPPQDVREIALAAISLNPRSVPLDVILCALPEDFKGMSLRPGSKPEISTTPPPIYVSTEPAALMIINGKELRAPIKDTELEFVVNTNWDLFYHKVNKSYYLLNGDAWQRSDSLKDPKWQITGTLPADFTELPYGGNWDEVKKYIPPRFPKNTPPEVIISFEPAELILIKGAPEFDNIVDTGIQWVSNSESDLFLYKERYYYLVSGRWFQSDKLKGEWISVEKIPEAFAQIPSTHPRGHVLVSVPGTEDARIASIEAQIPKKAKISVNAKAEEVIYDGEPKFLAIEGTDMHRAVNTSSQVIQVDTSYYLCSNAVWFSSPSPKGLWKIATFIPSEIYTIPASDPVHNVTYVYIYPEPEEKVTTHITYAYTSGYYGYYSCGTTLVYGTGYYYPPYYYYNPWGYPAYWYYPRAYGYGSWYNPATGIYGQRSVVYGPYGGSAHGSVYDPTTGAYGRGSTVWGYNEVARSAYGYNPLTNTYAAGNMYYDHGDNKGWRETYVERGNKWIYSETTLDGNNAYTEYKTARGIEGTSNRNREGDVITGSGNIQYGDRSAQISSRIDTEGANILIEGDQGGSKEISKEWGQKGRETTFTSKNGHTATGQTYRTEQGIRKDVKTSTGGKASSIVNESGRTTVGKTGSGELFAGRKGEVYMRSENGSWSQYDNGSWNRIDTKSRSDNSITYGRSHSVNPDRMNNLEKQYNARTNGKRNYQRFRSQRNYSGRSMNRSFRGGGFRR